MKLGWAYLGLAALLVVFGFALAIERGGYIGDLLLVTSLVFIYLGSNALADADEAERLTERTK
ncbi:MAG: hypothetical protein ACOC0Z_01530 [Halohasta sp.]